MERIRIAVVAPPWYPVPPHGYGGTELVVHLLVKGLRARGVDVTLFAAEGSRHNAIELAPAHWSDDLATFYHIHRETTYLARVTQRLSIMSPDLVHDHVGVSSPLTLAMSGFPVVHTTHGPVNEQWEAVYSAIGERAGLIAISAAQRRTAPELNWVGTVHNAVDTDALIVGDRATKEGYLLCLARISPEKGQHVAIDVARRCGRPLVLAGKVGEHAKDREYFETEVQPHIESGAVRWLDNVAGMEKAQLLAQADALLAPVQWPEPFGLAMVEAMASGTPVIAFGLGAIPELVTTGVTGFVVPDADAMVAAVSLTADVDVAECARIARSTFSGQAMADRYLGVYERVLSGAGLVSLAGTALADGERLAKSGPRR